MAKKKTKKKTKKKVSKKALKKKAWDVFSKYIRLKYSDENENCKCVTCGKIDHWSKMQAGHAIGGRNNAVLFHEKIVHVQCPGCNIFKHGNYNQYALFMIDTYGREEFERLLSLKNKVLKITDSNLVSIAMTYQGKIQELPNYNA